MNEILVILLSAASGIVIGVGIAWFFLTVQIKVTLRNTNDKDITPDTTTRPPRTYHR